jgi:hypothetical protein
MVQHLEQRAVILIGIQPMNNLAGQGGVVRQFKFCFKFFVIALQLVDRKQPIYIFLQQPVDAVFGIFLSLGLLFLRSLGKVPGFLQNKIQCTFNVYHPWFLRGAHLF